MDQFATNLNLRDPGSVIEYLRAGPAVITFEKVDKSIRIMRCTLKPDLILASVERAATVNEARMRDGLPQLPTTIAVWDLDASAWRSFRIEHLLTMGREV